MSASRIRLLQPEHRRDPDQALGTCRNKWGNLLPSRACILFGVVDVSHGSVYLCRSC